ncbi:Acyl-CoA dehydrogenase domain protein [Cupriavidus necator]|uniref:Acyl-CoA dehydrogenase domain protein n=1 Tax=Cupriavidus necator TaxID=106590 RepID=A0A1K0IRK1_CUPNE|nr:Acyl-CoA dehydrogenase domain protein [Cupriavidus necator]
MQTEADDMLVSMFSRMLQKQHPLSYARARHTLDEPGHASMWQQLAEGGWLELGNSASGESDGAAVLGIGETLGRTLLTLPLGFCAFVLRPLGEAVPALLDSGTLLPPDAFPAAGRIDIGNDDCPFVDFHGTHAQYYRITAGNPERDTWIIRRYTGKDVRVVDGLDGCVALGRLPDAPPAAESVFALPRQQMAALLRGALAIDLAEMLGAASAALDMAIAYAKERRQFGRLIGQYQAIKHPLANAWVALDNGRYAVRKLLADAPATGDTAGNGIEQTANRLVTTAATQATRLTIQVHGGIGFAWEHDAHLFLKRVYRLGARTRRLAGMVERVCGAVAST